jgi:pheromone shutdown protein TraB
MKEIVHRNCLKSMCWIQGLDAMKINSLKYQDLESLATREEFKIWLYVKVVMVS